MVFSKSGKSRLLKIQYSPLVRPCFEAENNQRKIGRSMCFLSLRSETDRLTEPAKQRYRHFSFCPDISPYPAKQNPRGTRIPASLFAKLRKLAKLPFSLCSIGCSTQLWGLHSKPLLTLILLILLIEGLDFKSGPVAILLWSGFAIAIPAIFAIRRGAFEVRPLP